MLAAGLAASAFAAALAGGAEPADRNDRLAGPATAERLSAWVAGRLPTLEHELRAGIAARLRAPSRHGRPARLFTAAVAAPLGFVAPLAAFAGRLGGPAPEAWFDTLDHLVRREWTAQYDGRPACVPAPRRTPASLDEAVEQIRAAAREHARLSEPRAVSRLLAAERLAATPRLARTHTGALRRRERRALRRYARTLAQADLPAALCAAAQWSRLAAPAWLRGLRALLAEHPSAEAAVIRRESTPWGEIVFGGRADGVIRSRTLLFLADLDGNDFHGADGGADNAGRPQLIVDYGGDDRYESTMPGGYAGGVGRTAIVVDFGGDDSYLGAAFSQGAGLVGVGALIDLGGDDRYRAREHAQGAAWFGVGLLWDGGGDDLYAVEALGQGLGMTHGIGALLDLDGDDAYTALGGAPTGYGTPALADAWAQGVGRGLRGIAPAGIGLLSDSAGDDRYDAGAFAQGGAYYHGVGQLLDHGAGRDTLLGGRYNAGWGAHGGVGRFFNAGGDDRYATRHVVAAGLAWDYSLALFHDAAGDDAYHLPGFSFGSAAHGSAAMFIDSAGSDVYRGRVPLQARPRAPNLAIFFDADSGSDREDGAPVADAPSCIVSERHAFALRALVGQPLGCAGAAPAADPSAAAARP